MSQLEWNRPEAQVFEAGLDRGVIYLEDGSAVPWNGLTNVDDDGDSTISEFYLDGVKYLSIVSPRDWKGKLSAYTYPDEFGELIGVAELGDGLFVDSQAPGRFDLSYRTMVSAPAVDTKQHYKIHLIYKVMASLGSIKNETMSDNTKPTEFDFDLSAVPVVATGIRPTSHVILDTRHIDETTLASLETMLYGDADSEPAVPTIEDLVNLLKFPDTVTVVYNGDGTWTATGSNDNIYMLDSQGHFQIDGVNAVYIVPAEIYEFPDLDALSELSLMLDEDGTPYMGSAVDNDTNVGEDTDGTPYIEDNEADMSLHIDTDGAYYFEDLTP